MLVTALITNYIFTSLLESVEIFDAVGKESIFENEFLVSQGLRSFWSVSSVF